MSKKVKLLIVLLFAMPFLEACVYGDVKEEESRVENVELENEALWLFHLKRRLKLLLTGIK